MTRFLIKIVLVFVSTSVFSTELLMIKWPTANWPGLTDNYSALYDSIFQEVFTIQGYTLEKSYIPFKRAIKMVDYGLADIAGGTLKESTVNTNHIQAPFPVLTTPVMAFYNRHKFRDKFMGIETLQHHSVVSSHQSGVSIGLRGVHEVNTKTQAFMMVAKGRVDFYIDDKGVLLKTVAENKAKLKNFNEDDFETSIIGITSWYMIFPRNKRGKEIMKGYIEGTAQLYESGRLTQLYERRGFSVPIAFKAYLKYEY